jgi:putative ABC transport system permease protein
VGAVRRAVALPPAEAMRPESPASFRPGPVERIGLGGWLPASGRMILRNVERRPFRAVASSIGVAFSVSILVVGLFFLDAVTFMADLQFGQIQREDLAVHFTSQRPLRVRHDLANLQGVDHVEIFRSVPVRIGEGPNSRPTAITGLQADALLRPVVDQSGSLVPLPAEGLVLNRKLAEVTGAWPGEQVLVRVLDGARPERSVPVAALVDEMFGLAAYMDYDALHRLLGEAPTASGAYLAIDPEHRSALNERLKRLPAIASVYSPAVLRETFDRQIEENLFISISFLLVLACVLTIGIIYNGARIALSERGRELASLRVLGFTRREVGVLLLGEQAALTALAIPLGWVIGVFFASGILGTLDAERYRIPLFISGQTYFLSASFAVLASTLAGLAVRRRVNRLDLIEVLKTRE